MHFDCSVSTIRRVLAGPAPDAGTARIGRPPAISKVPPALITAARRLALADSRSADLRARAPLALRTLAAATGYEIPADLCARITSGKRLPTSIRRAITQGLTAEVATLDRSGKRAALQNCSVPTSNNWVDTEGEFRPLLPMDWLNADDMHCNFPYWTEVPPAADMAGDEVIETHGVFVSRAQLLAVQDVGTLRFIGHALWCQHNDAYGAYAILWTLSRTLAQHGIPRGGFGLEHGAWDSRLINDSLGSIGTAVVHHDTAKGKRIEMAFNELQRIMSVRMALAGRESFELGRRRGEYESGKRMWLAMRAGKADPRALGVPHIGEMSAFISACMEQYNDTVSNGKILRGQSPNQSWASGMASAATPRRLTAIDRWRLMPGRSEVSLRDGAAVARSKIFGPEGRWFVHPRLFAVLGRNFPVEIRYDLAEPLTCGVFSRCPVERAPTRGWLAQQLPDVFEGIWPAAQLTAPIAPGDFLAEADRLAEMPKYTLSRWSDYSAGSDTRKTHARTVRAVYRGIVSAGDAPAPLTDEAHDGAGNSRRMEVAEGTEAPPVGEAQKGLPVPHSAPPRSSRTEASAPIAPPPPPTRAPAASTSRQWREDTFGDRAAMFTEVPALAPAPLSLDDVPY
jgi:hypothetical protein